VSFCVVIVCMCTPLLSKRFVIIPSIWIVRVLVWMSFSRLHSFGSMWMCGKFVICSINLVSLY
jgi:hypothetical protein